MGHLTSIFYPNTAQIQGKRTAGLANEVSSLVVAQCEAEGTIVDADDAIAHFQSPQCAFTILLHKNDSVAAVCSCLKGETEWSEGVDAD